MRAFLIAGATSLVLAGCVTSSGVQQSVAQGCQALQVADLAFKGAISLGIDIPQSIINAEALAVAVVADICADPTAVTDTDSALRAIGRALVAVGQALDEAEARGAIIDVPPA
jgi:hypothetical protein